MVAIVGGSGLGILNTSLNTVGAAGVTGDSLLGQGGTHAVLNVANGNLVVQSEDGQLAGRGADLLALRTYNSLDATAGVNGDGWRWNYEQTVAFQGPGAPAQPSLGATVVRTDGDGHETSYTWNSARSAYVGTDGGGAHDRLTYDVAASEWVWSDGSSRTTERYSNSTTPSMTGRLLRRTDASHNSIALAYDAGRLTTIKDPGSQQELRLTYGLSNGATRPQRLDAHPLTDDANGRPTTTLGPPLRVADYDYDPQGRLAAVTRYLSPAPTNAPAGPGFTTEYSYEGSSRRIAGVSQSDGTGVSFSYDAAGRVTEVRDAGGTTATQLSLAYGPQNSTAVTDGTGQVWTYRHDATSGQLIEVVAPAASGTPPSTTFDYDGRGNLTALAGPDNNAAIYGYDSAGNRVLDRDAFGNTTARTFSPLNQVLTETRYRSPDPDGGGPQDPNDPVTTRYVYDANGRLRFMVSAEGRVTEHRYGDNAAYGRLTETRLYLGQLFDVTTLAPGDPVLESELANWISALPDVTQVQLTENRYDLRGKLSQQTSYATVSTAGSGLLDAGGSVAEYVHDSYSRLRQRIDVRGNARDRRLVTSRFAHDGIARVIESGGANGVDATDYEDANQRVTLTTASGLIETREYDSRRRLVRISQAGDGVTRQTRSVYDAADRLRMTEDGEGTRRYRFYDAAGRLEFKVDATRAVTRFEYNAGGQLVRQTQYARRADSTNWYDATAEAVTKGTLTIGGSSADVEVDPASDRVTSFSYDAAGRLAVSTDAENTVTVISYDGLSRVLMTQTGSRATRYLYDSDNRRVGIVDGLGYLTEFTYDAGGRLKETIRYSQLGPAAANVTAPVAIGINDEPSPWRPVSDTGALRSYLYYDGQGRVAGEVDEQQFLTETIYDEELNTRQTLRYLTPISVVPGDDLASVRARAGASRRIALMQFDDFGRAREVATFDGSTRTEFDEAGRVARVVSAAGTAEERIRSTFYNAFGDVTGIVGGEGSAWLGTNPSPQRIDQAVREFGTRYEYDSVGRLVRSIDANANQTLFYYDGENRRTHTVNVVGQSADNSLAGEVSETIYNAFGQIESMRRYRTRIGTAALTQLLVDGGGGLADQALVAVLAGIADANLDQRTLAEYDRCGRLAKHIDGVGGFVENSYNPHGELATQVRFIGFGRTTSTQFDYDARGRVVLVTGDAGGMNPSRATAYDAFGRVVQATDAAGGVVNTGYPDNGRTVAVTDGLQRTTRTSYDGLGRVASVTDALGKHTNYTYDESTRSTMITSPEGRQVTTIRTRHGETESVTDGRGNITRSEFNRDGQPRNVTDAMGRVTFQAIYDKSGRLFESTDACGTLTRFGYDQRNRLVARQIDPAGLNITTLFAFDALGQQISVTDGAGTSAKRITVYEYDRKGRTTRVVVDAASSGLQLATTYEYDDLDNIVTFARGTVSSPNQHVVLYAFDNLGRRVSETAAPASVFGPGTPGTRDMATEYRYDATGRLTRRVDSNGQSTWFVYDAAAQLTHVITALGDVTENRYDHCGRLVYTHRYLARLAPNTIAGLGDVAAAPASPNPAPNDRRGHVVYDADGKARFNVNAAGATGWVIAESRHDAHGNVVEVRNYDQFLSDSRVAALNPPAASGITVQQIQEELRTTLGYQDENPDTLAGTPRTVFAYDACNRLRFTIDPLGSVLENVSNTAGSLIATWRYAVPPTLTDYSEAAIEAAADRDHADNRITRYAHDAAGRLRYTLDTLNSVTENRYDARGNLIGTVRWGMRPALAQHTESEIAAALPGQPDSARDHVMRFVYDAGDRVRFTIDARGSVSENVYDAVGHVIESTGFARRPPAAPVAFTEAAVTAAVAPLRTDLENQTTRSVYDADGRLRFTVDPLGSVTKNDYDAAGNLLATIRFAVRPTLSQYDEGAIDAAVAALTPDARNRTNRFAYDTLKRVRFSIDALGSVSERVYDTIGNVITVERFAERPTLAQHAESAVDAAVAPARGAPGNRIEHHVHDALGRIRFSVRRVSVDAGVSRYHVTAQELNALGRAVTSTSYAETVAPASLEEAAISAAVGGGNPSADRMSRFIYDLAGRQIYRLQVITVAANTRHYRVNAQQFDTFGQAIHSTDYADTIAPAAFDAASIEAAVQAIADDGRDRVSGMAYDTLGQAVFSVQRLSAGSHQLIEQEYDALGRMFRTTMYATARGPLVGFDRTTIEGAAAVAASPTDRTTHYVYDTAGRQRFVLQADSPDHWTVTESRFDSFGNLAESRRYDRFLTDTWMASFDGTDPAGPSEQDVVGQLSSLGYNDAVPATLLNLQRSRLVSDRQNRVRFTIDALGGVVENIYNALGDLTGTVRFATRPAPGGFSEAEIDASLDRSDAGNRVQRFAPDANGSIRFDVQVLEPNLGTGGRHTITERRYDALAQLVQTVAYATPVGPVAGCDEAALAAAVVSDSANDRRSVVVYDPGGRQAFTLRALRAGIDDRYVVTRQVHDAMSQIVQRTEYASPVAITQFDMTAVDGTIVPNPGHDRVSTYVRDAAGRLRFEIRPDLSFGEKRYDALDRVLEERRIDFTLPGHELRTESEMEALRGSRAVGDGVTRGQTHAYDAAGRRVRSADAAGNIEEHEYDALGGRTRWTDKNGNVSACAFDRKGRKTVETTPALSFKLRGEPLTPPAPDRVLETRFEYDAFGQLVRRIDAANHPSDSSTIDYSFDVLGRPTGALSNGYYDPEMGSVERYPGGSRFRLEAAITYDALGNTVRVSNRTGLASFQHSYHTYDARGQVVHDVNALNHVTRHTYTALGERETVTRYSVTLTGTQQNGVYWTAAEIDPKLNFGLDELGHVMEDFNARTIRLAYDTLGRKIAVTLPTATFYSTHMPGDPSHNNDFRPSPETVVGVQDAPVTRYEYNTFGDLILQRVRANNIVEWQDTAFSRDRMGRATSSTNAAGHITSMSYDIAGNLVLQSEPSGELVGWNRTTQFAYNILDQQVRIDRYRLRYTDANGVEHGVATWTWANGGEWIDPDADVATTVRASTFDPYGRPLVVTDAAGNATSMRYDALGRLVEIVEPARMVAPIGANGEAAVDPFHNQQSETRVTSMTLDPFGLPLRQVGATSQGSDPRETLQSYDAAGNLLSTTDAEGHVKRRACDYAGRVIRETQSIEADLGALGINAQGLERRYAYDVLGQLTDTLDVYVDGTDLVQSGKSVVYNPFGEVTEELRKWGPATDSPETLNTARVAWYHFDNAGHVFEKLAADRLTLYFYNLLGQVTREEKRGNSGDSDGTGKRITEYQHDVLGRPTMVRLPTFNADVTPGTGTSTRLVTPYASRSLDRWGNVRGTQEGGYEFGNGQTSFMPHRIFRSFTYDGNNRLVSEHPGTHGFISSSGSSANALISKAMFRDLLGNVVREEDRALEPQSEAVLNSRIRRKEYDSAGRLTAEIDATQIRVEYACNVHGDRLGSRNARGTVFFDRVDRKGNIRFHGVLRRSSRRGALEYESRAKLPRPRTPLTRTYLKAYLYDQAGRRFASKTFTEGANAPWSYTWLDGRNLGVRHLDVMGLRSESRFDPFGNKSVEIDSAGVRKEWKAATADYFVGRIETYILPGDSLLRFGQHAYNDYGEVTFDTVANTRTEYVRHRNGLVSKVIITPDVTKPAEREETRYEYDTRGQLTMEGRLDFGTNQTSSIQTRMISYDNQGRLSRVEQSKAPGGVTCDVGYAYDEWSSIRRVQATYTYTGLDGPYTTTSWYDYDRAGRLIVSNGRLEGGRIRPKTRARDSVQIGYDTVGRRSGTTEHLRHNIANLPTLLRTWETMRDEHYEYNDLGHLRKIDQRLRSVDIVETSNATGDPVDKPPRIGPWKPLLVRSSNLRGDVTRSEQWTRVWNAPNDLDVNKVPTKTGVTTSAYRADGQVSWTKTDATDPKKSTETQNTYNAQTGLLDSYVFNAFRSDGVPFTANYEYRYAFHRGERVVRAIRDFHSGLDTTKTYDAADRLWTERINLPTPNDVSGSDRYEKRVYDHGADGRIIFKNAWIQLSSSGPGTIDPPDPADGQQTYVYASNRLVGTIGTRRLIDATRFDFAYTPMSESAGSGSSRYVVQNGDSLIDIAQAGYGDGALWYMVADANGITSPPDEPLPTAEVGKSYELPDVVRSSHTATTFTPFGIGDIIGNDRPIAIPPPPPHKASDIEMMAVAAVSITIQVGVTVGLSYLGVPAPISYGIAAGLSNFGGQATAWELGMQAPGKQGIDWGSVGMAAFEGYMFSAAGPAGGVAREMWHQGTSGFTGWTSGPGLNWSGIAGSLFNVGFDALGPVMGGPTRGAFHFGLAGLINSAYNPSSGWALPGSSRSPVVGAFEYAYSGVASGLANMAFDWIRQQLERPTAPSKPSGPRSVDKPRGRLSADLTDAWDELDRQQVLEEDRNTLAAINARTEAESNERLGLELGFADLEDKIAHFGEGINDRAIIASARRQMNEERVRREQAAALTRARAAARAAKLRANEARFQAAVAAGPILPPEWGEDPYVKDQYADGTWTHVSENFSIDGLKFEGRRGIYDASGFYTARNTEMDQIVDLYRKLSNQPGSSPAGFPVVVGNELIYVQGQAPDEPPLVGNEVIIIHDPATPAEQSRRLGLDNIANFEQFTKIYKYKHGTTEGVQREFLDYHETQSKRVVEGWRRIDNAMAITKTGLLTLATAPLAGFDPFLMFGPLIVGAGAERLARFAGFDDASASGFGTLAMIGSSFAMPSVRSLGLVRTQSEIQSLLAAERAARWEANAAQMEARGLEWEMTRGIALGDGMTLYKGIPARARGAKGPVIADVQSGPMVVPDTGAPSFLAATVAGTAGAIGIAIEPGDFRLGYQGISPTNAQDLNFSRMLVQNMPEWPAGPGLTVAWPTYRFDPHAAFPKTGNVTVLQGPAAPFMTPVPQAFFPPVSATPGRVMPANLPDVAGLAPTMHPELFNKVDQMYWRRPFGLGRADAPTVSALAREFDQMVRPGGFVEFRVLPASDVRTALEVARQMPGARAVEVPRNAIRSYAATNVRPTGLSNEQWVILEAAGPDIRGEFGALGQGIFNRIIRVYTGQ